jgi:diguanylate cyclase (GGDEF)-like protein
VRLLPFISSATAIGIDLLHEPPPDPAEPALTQAQRVIQALRLARTSTGLCKIAVNDIRRLSGFDRVMVYRFDEDGSGDVVAENHAPGVISFLGLKYPASDIPQQARRLYMLQRIRVIPDVNAEPVALLSVPGSLPTDVDLSASWVRAVSPIHLQYLRHMGVTATAVVSLIVAGRLWGMLVCHHNSPRPVNADQRALLDLVGQVMSVMLGSLTESEQSANRLQRQRALGAIAAAVAKHEETMTTGFAARAGDLVNLVPAHGAIVTVGEQTIVVGHTPGPEALARILAALQVRDSEDLVATATLGELVGDAAAPLDGFAGALLLPLPNCARGSVLWFRRELQLTVNWAGNPAKTVPDPVSGRLEPRLSFETWTDHVRGRSAPWTVADLDAARELRRVVDEALVRRHESELLLRLRDNDPLTGLLNRQAVETHLSTLSALPTPPQVVLATLNVDRFRKVNEMLGNSAGDALLVQIAHRLQVMAAPGELIARLGTDEFGLLASASTPEDLAVRLAAVFSQPFEIARQVLQMHASVGIVDSSAVGADVLGLLNSAAAALRQAKTSGGNRVSFFASSLRDDTAHQLELEQSLDTALRSNREQFELMFQPIVDVPSGALRSWEVLIRWNHPTLGSVPPGVFIPIAESSGLVAAIGDFVLDEALRHLVEVPGSNQPGEQDVYLSVNVSPLQLVRPGFAGEVAQLLQTRAVRPGRLCIEVTEGVFANAEAVAAIGEIRRLGVLVAVDDFGTGYSSLSALQRLPADVVKLDRSFLPKQEVIGPADHAFLSAVVALAHTTGLKVVVEGVETQAQLNATVLAGADAIQGYYLARPMPNEAAMALACQSQQERSWHDKFESAAHCAADPSSKVA